MKKATIRRAAPAEALSLQDLCRFCAADEDWVIALVRQGVLTPRGASAEEWQFQGRSILRAKKARRLTRDYDLNPGGLGLVLDLLEEREQILRRLARADMV